MAVGFDSDYRGRFIRTGSGTSAFWLAVRAVTRGRCALDREADGATASCEPSPAQRVRAAPSLSATAFRNAMTSPFPGTRDHPCLSGVSDEDVAVI